MGAGAGGGEESPAGMGKLVTGKLAGWAAGACVSVPAWWESVGRVGFRFGGSMAWIGELCGNGELVSGEDSGLGSWAVWFCACVTGRPAVGGLGGVGLFCGIMRPLAGMAQKSP